MRSGSICSFISVKYELSKCSHSGVHDTPPFVPGPSFVYFVLSLSGQRRTLSTLCPENAHKAASCQGHTGAVPERKRSAAHEFRPLCEPSRTQHTAQSDIGRLSLALSEGAAQRPRGYGPHTRGEGMHAWLRRIPMGVALRSAAHAAAMSACERGHQLSDLARRNGPPRLRSHSLVLAQPLQTMLVLACHTRQS
jgi:hypothetical protein